MPNLYDDTAHLRPLWGEPRFRALSLTERLAVMYLLWPHGEDGPDDPDPDPLPHPSPEGLARALQCTVDEARALIEKVTEDFFNEGAR